MNIVFQQRWSLLTASWKLCFLWGALFPIISSVDHNLLWRTLSSTIGPVHNSCWLNVEVFLVWKFPEELFYHFHQEMCFREFLCWIKKFVWFLLYTVHRWHCTIYSVICEHGPLDYFNHNFLCGQQLIMKITFIHHNWLKLLSTVQWIKPTI